MTNKKTGRKFSSSKEICSLKMRRRSKNVQLANQIAVLKYIEPDR